MNSFSFDSSFSKKSIFLLNQSKRFLFCLSLGLFFFEFVGLKDAFAQGDQIQVEGSGSKKKKKKKNKLASPHSDSESNLLLLTQQDFSNIDGEGDKEDWKDTPPPRQRPPSAPFNPPSSSPSSSSSSSSSSYSAPVLEPSSSLYFTSLKSPPVPEPSSSLYFASLKEESGTFGLQDLEGEEPKSFTFFTHSIVRDLQKDIVNLESEMRNLIKGKDPEDTRNILTAEIVLYSTNKKFYKIPLHYFINNTEKSVFHSGKNSDKVGEILKPFLTDIIPISIEEIMSWSHAVPHTYAGMLARKNRMTAEKSIRQHLKSMEDEIEETRMKSLGIIKYLTGNEPRTKSELFPVINDIQSFSKKFAKSAQGYGPAAMTFQFIHWHSEIRLLCLLKKISLQYDKALEYIKLKYGEEEAPGPIEAVALHLHSTLDVCNNCRLELVGATYEWLYEKMSKAFKNGPDFPLFHIIVSWNHEYPKSTNPQKEGATYKKKVNSLNVSKNAASYYDLNVNKKINPIHIILFYWYSEPEYSNKEYWEVFKAISGVYLEKPLVSFIKLPAPFHDLPDDKERE